MLKPEQDDEAELQIITHRRRGLEIPEAHRPAGRIRVRVPEVLGRTAYRDARNVAGKRILLAEDNPADVLLIREALGWHEVDSHLFVLRDGDEAIKLIDEIENYSVPCPDLIVLDVNLPRQSGFDVLASVRSSTKCRKTPVAMLTSSEAGSDQAAASRLGASLYIQKPSSLSGFMSVGGTLKGLLSGRCSFREETTAQCALAIAR